MVEKTEKTQDSLRGGFVNRFLKRHPELTSYNPPKCHICGISMMPILSVVGDKISTCWRCPVCEKET